MDDSGAILLQISSLKDMLDQVNADIEESIQVTREIESEIVKCSELGSHFALREAELTKMAYVFEFEIVGLKAVTADLKTSVKFLEEELCCFRTKHNETFNRIIVKRELFTASCLNFQKDISHGENDELRALSLERELLQNELHLLDRKTSALNNSMLAFVEDILGDLHSFNSALCVEVQTRRFENENLERDIEELKATLISLLSTTAV